MIGPVSHVVSGVISVGFAAAVVSLARALATTGCVGRISVKGRFGMAGSDT